jgi:hypothetical protein
LLDIRVGELDDLSGVVRLARDGSSYRPCAVVGSVVVGPDGEAGIVASVQGWPRLSSVSVLCARLAPGGRELRTSWLAGAPAEVTADLDRERDIGGTVFLRAS